MGNYNCRGCIERDINNTSELLLKNKVFSNETNEECNTRNERLKSFKSNEKEKENNNIQNVETDISVGKKELIKKMKNKNETNQYSLNDLKKEERENNILLKNELDKIKDIGANSNRNNETLDIKKENENNINNEIKNEISNKEDYKLDNNQKKESENIINKESLEQQKIIENQKETILEQQKIIEQYKQQQLLYEQQQMQLQKAQLKIKEQQNQLENLEPQNDIVINKQQQLNNENSLRKSPNYLNENKETKIVNISQNKKKSSSKSSPKPKTKELINKEKLEKEIQNQQEPQIQYVQAPKEQIYDENIQMQYFQNIDMNEQKQLEQYALQEENNLDEINNYERVEDLEELKDKMGHHYQSQKFKIETYEPIEQSNNNEINNDENYENNLDNHNLYKNENIYFRKEGKKEPQDTLKYGIRKPIIPKPNNNRYISSDKAKRESGPKDSSGKKNVHFNFRGTFEGKSDNNNDMKINEFGPRDSKRKINIDKNESLKNKFNDEPINSNENINPIAGAISNSILNNKNYNLHMNMNNENINQQIKYNYIKNKVIPMIQIEKINQNIGLSSTEDQKESPRFNEVIDSQNQQIYYEENNNLQNLQNVEYGSEKRIQNYDYNMREFGSYINESADINGTVSSGNALYNNDNQVINGSHYNTNIIQHNNNYEMTNSEMENPLLYSDDMGNMNYLEKKYSLYQNQLNLNNNEENNF